MEATPRSYVAAGPPRAVATASASDFQRDLSRYWRHVRAKGELGLTARGWIYKTAFKTLLSALNEPPDAPDSEQEQPRLLFMRQLLIGLKELADSQGSLTINPAGHFFQMPLPARIKRSFETWRDANVASESARVGDLKQATPGGPRWDPTRHGLASAIKTRATVLRAMARAEKTLEMEHSLGLGNLPPSRERWMSVAALMDAVARPDALSGSNASEHAGLPDRPIVLAMLAGPLHWLGVLDLGYGASNDMPGQLPGHTPADVLPTTYRLTDTGLWLLDVADEPAFVESGGRVLVQPNFTILAMEPISDRVLMDLDQFADLQASDRATAYQLTRQSVYRGQRGGWDVKRIAAFLEDHQATPLPANVKRSLDEWQALHHRIVFYRDACVIQFADQVARDGVTRVLAEDQLKPVPLGPAHTLVEPGSNDARDAGPDTTAAQVIATLSNAGWMPQVSPASASLEGRDDTESCLRLVPSEESPGCFDVLFKQPVPSLFALGQLAPLLDSRPASPEASPATAPAHRPHTHLHPHTRLHADTDRDAPSGPSPELRLTAAGIRGALSNGISLDEILATLAHLHDGPLPTPVEQSIRNWSRFFGRATANTVCLFEFSDQEVLNNLLDDESIGHYLSPIDGSVQPLVAVDPVHADVVRELLAERGIDVTG